MCAFAPLARANGRPAQTLSVSFDPARPSRILLSTTFGLLVSDDDGASWRWACEAALETDGLAVNPVYRVAAGTLLQASPGGILYSRDDGCGWAQAVLGDASAQDVAVDPADARHVLAAGEASAGSGVFVSSDGGASFAAPATLTPNVVLRDLRFASDGVLLLSWEPGTSTARLLRSNDGGRSFVVAGSMAGVSSAPALVGPRPTDGSLYVLAGGAVYRSQDGGASFTPLGDFGTVYAGDVADDGTVYLATAQGILRSTDGQSFGAAGSTVVTCLAWHAGALLGCTTPSLSGVALARSNDGGASFAPLLRLGENLVGPLECLAGTTVCVECYAQWPQLASQFGQPSPTEPMCATEPDAGVVDAQADAPANPPPPAPSTGCGCQVGGRAPAPAGILLLVLLRRRKRA